MLVFTLVLDRASEALLFVIIESEAWLPSWIEIASSESWEIGISYFWENHTSSWKTLKKPILAWHAYLSYPKLHLNLLSNCDTIVKRFLTKIVIFKSYHFSFTIYISHFLAKIKIAYAAFKMLWNVEIISID